MINKNDLVRTPVDLEYWNGSRWVYVGGFPNETIAWMSLGDDNDNYRTIDPLNGSTIREA